MGKNENIHSGLVWYKRIALEIVWGLCFVIGCSPRWFRFGVLLPFFSFLLRAVRYRKSTVIENLTKSFPEKSEAEIRDIARRFYDTLAEVVVTTLSLSATTPERYGKVLEWHDPQGHIERTRGRDWVAMAAHYGCWEYYPLWSWEDGDCRFMSVYHTLKSEVFEHLYRRLRSRLAKNITIVPMQDAIRYYIKNRTKEHSTVLGLVSDQSPVMRADSQWMDFLNQTTLFIDGAERIAMRFGIPVYFVVAERVEYGRYKAKFVELYDGVEEVAEGVIRRRYADALEAMIRRSPELWMWSHKRWKHTPEKQAKKFGASTLK